MYIISEFLSKISLNKLTKKTIACVVVIFLFFFKKMNEINLIIKLLLLSIVFVVIKMLCIKPYKINLENNILKNCIGMITIITLLRKTSFITLPDIIINAINTFINNTNTIAEKYLDGNNNCVNTNPNPNPNSNCIIENNELNKDNTINNTFDSVEKIIIKSVFEKFISKFYKMTLNTIKKITIAIIYFIYYYIFNKIIIKYNSKNK